MISMFPGPSIKLSSLERWAFSLSVRFFPSPELETDVVEVGYNVVALNHSITGKLPSDLVRINGPRVDRNH